MQEIKEPFLWIFRFILNLFKSSNFECFKLSIVVLELPMKGVEIFIGATHRPRHSIFFYYYYLIILLCF